MKWNFLSFFFLDENEHITRNYSKRISTVDKIICHTNHFGILRCFAERVRRGDERSLQVPTIDAPTSSVRVFTYSTLYIAPMKLTAIVLTTLFLLHLAFSMFFFFTTRCKQSSHFLKCRLYTNICWMIEYFQIIFT